MSLSFFYSLRPTLGRKIHTDMEKGNSLIRKTERFPGRRRPKGGVDNQKQVNAPSMTKSEPVVKVAASLAR